MFVSRYVACWVLGLTVCLGIGCGDDFSPASTVTNTRLIGVRVEVVDDPERAWPSPGEEVRVRHLVVTPDGSTPEVSFVSAACPDLDLPSGTAQCAGDFFAATGGVDLVSGVEDFVFTVPAEEAFTDVRRVRVLGGLCPGASLDIPSGFDPENVEAEITEELLSACTPPEAEDTTVLSYGIELQSEEESNRHPNFLEEGLRLAGAPWLSAPSELSCAEAGSEALPRVTALDESVAIGVAISEEDREPFVEVAGSDTDPIDRLETLQISNFTTAGELERQFSFFDDDSGTEAIFGWNTPLPEDLPPEGRLVRFYFVLRDGRGGLDVAERALCVFP